MARPSADARVLHSWLALRKHQHKRAISEAEAALALNPNDAEALEALAEALIYSGRPQDGMLQAQRAMARNPLLLGRPLYLLGLAEFALGNPDQTILRLARAIELAPAHRPEFSGLLAAAYGELGRAAEADAAFAVYQQGLLNRPALAWSVAPQPFENPRYHTWWRVDLAWAVYAHPFTSREVLARLAKGLEVAGATSGIGGFLPVYAETRLTGKDIRALLFGASIGGKGLKPGAARWRQDRAADGTVRHSGYPLHPGLARAATGIGWIAGDRLCERWPGPGPDAEIETCVAIYRIADAKARLRWGGYVMATDTGPHPFSIIE
jgi:tetratricopeptide (TPR) repeat protein